MHINKKSPIPVYYQLKNILLKKIQDEEYRAGELIPSERDLGESLGISRMTVRQALSQLVAEGVLYREKGKGTFVSKGKIQQRNIMSFSETVRKKGLVPSARILSFQKHTELYDIKDILGLRRDDGIYAIKRLRLANERPVAIEEVFMPEIYFPRLDKFDLNTSLYKLIKEEYSYAISFIDNNIEASKPSAEEKELLSIALTSPVLRVTGINYTEEGSRLFYERAVYCGDQYNYNVRIYMSKEI
ncbi:GntR family transcriptional regulator [Anaerobacterium chartisolvens]|uniref:GntR family transcriptional regulator n=1 Tax=Anaerobacterium chartisolvens TaxID=1297424 RepID=A0A369AVZ1_9FIRM|nr:GntR family transcriptional regulator [Anaerobacterium chartisolvens]RCX13225.1 GntR family transcriptional regulator [Anaerobacterium chartisolvens]